VSEVTAMCRLSRCGAMAAPRARGRSPPQAHLMLSLTFNWSALTTLDPLSEWRVGRNVHTFTLKLVGVVESTESVVMKYAYTIFDAPVARQPALSTAGWVGARTILPPTTSPNDT